MASAQVDEHDYSCHGQHQIAPTRSLRLDEQRMVDDSNMRSDTFDLQHYDIHIDITDYFGQTIDCHTSIEIKALMTGQTSIRLDLKDLDVTEVMVDGVPSTFDHSGEVLEILLLTPTLANETFYLDVWYNGHPYQDPQWGGFYFESNYIYNLGIGLSTIPPNFGRVWYPCFDTFVERATYDWYVTSAGGLVPHCQGEFVSEIQLVGDTLTRHYAMDIPLPTYLTAIAAADYTSISYDHVGAYGTIPVLLHAKTGQQSSMQTRFTNLPAAIDALEYWFGPYIWNKVGYVMTTVGAMEHATNIAYPQGMMSQSTASNEGLFTHELGHLWWGDMVSPEVRNHMWLKEGNAEYSQHLMREWLSGEEAFKAEVKDNQLYVLETANYEDGGFFAMSPIPDEIIYGRTTYYKGASVVHNLRGCMGDSLFRMGMQAVLDTFYLGYMNPEDFKSVLSSSTGLDLTSYFDDQIYKPGFSTFVIDSAQTTDLGDGTWNHHIFLQQKLRGCPSFYADVPLDITFLDQAWQKSNETVMVTGQYMEVDIVTGFEPIMTWTNGENRLNQARMEYQSILTETTNTLDLPWVDFKLKVEEIAEGDSAYFLAEHHWVSPDQQNLGEYIDYISDQHYYSIHGAWPASLLLTARFNYNVVFAHQLDNSLLANGPEENVGLVYRADASEPWEVYDNYTMSGVGGNNGTAKAETLKQGDYTFALLNPLVSLEEPGASPFRVYPNPVNDACFIHSDLDGGYEIEVIDSEGRTLSKQIAILSKGSPFKLSTGNWVNGIYQLRISKQGSSSIYNLKMLKEGAKK